MMAGEMSVEPLSTSTSSELPGGCSSASTYSRQRVSWSARLRVQMISEICTDTPLPGALELGHRPSIPRKVAIVDGRDRKLVAESGEPLATDLTRHRQKLANAGGQGFGGVRGEGRDSPGSQAIVLGDDAGIRAENRAAHSD